MITERLVPGSLYITFPPCWRCTDGDQALAPVFVSAVQTPGAERHHQLLGVHTSIQSGLQTYQNILQTLEEPSFQGAPSLLGAPSAQMLLFLFLPTLISSGPFWPFPSAFPRNISAPEEVSKVNLSNLFHIIHSHLFNYTQNYSTEPHTHCMHTFKLLGLILQYPKYLLHLI